MPDLTRKKAEEDLHTIKKIMQSCALQQQSEGIYFKIWGLLIPAATIMNLFMIYLFKWYFLAGPLWAIIMITGIIITYFTIRKRKSGNSRSMGSKLQKSIWISCLVSIALLYSLGVFSRTLTLNATMMGLAILLGNSVFISGTLSGSNLLKIVASGWWITGIVVIFLPGAAAAATIGIITFFFNFLPGVILDKKYKKDQIQFS